MKRYNSLVPKEMKLLSNLKEMRVMARAADIDSAKDMVSNVRSRKRKVTEVMSEPARQSPRLQTDSQSKSTPQRMELLEEELDRTSSR